MDMAAPVTTAGPARPAKTLDLGRCVVHHQPLALCEYVPSACPNDGLVFIPGVDGELDPSACLCPVCTGAVA